MVIPQKPSELIYLEKISVLIQRKETSQTN